MKATPMPTPGEPSAAIRQALETIVKECTDAEMYRWKLNDFQVIFTRTPVATQYFEGVYKSVTGPSVVPENPSRN